MNILAIETPHQNRAQCGAREPRHSVSCQDKIFSKSMNILAIETSCDETAMALVEATGGIRAPRFRILKNIVSSQIKIHAPYGGVVPNLAKREHLKNLPKVFATLYPKPYTLNPDLIAVTVGPGLEPALWTGIEFAKRVTSDMGHVTRKRIPLVGVNHLEGHLYSFLFEKTASSKSKILISKRRGRGLEIRDSRLEFPAVSLLVSGGHTILVHVDSLAHYKKLGETRDDAAGEAFDKVARMLGLPYPGGPEVEKLAQRGNPNAIPFPRPMLHTKTYDFSFSGLKTAVLYYLRDMRHGTRDMEQSGNSLRRANDTNNIKQRLPALIRANSRIRNADVAASFQQAVIDVLVAKTMRAAREFGARSIMLSGGVAANRALRQALKRQAIRARMNFFVPPSALHTDNAVMIAGAAYINYLRKKKYRLIAQPNLNF